MAIRFIVEVAWQAHFVKNMFIQPTAEELENFEPDFVVYNASKAKVENYKELGLNSETAVMFNITSREQVIVNTWYGGEMKKGMFSMMNYYLPLKGIASMHCSANTDLNGENTAIFFGLSGTGKTTLSTDPKRLLIGDDEHGWDDNGVFNFEGGCYAKVIDLDKESEPDIYNAIKRDALLENVTLDAEGKIDFTDKSVTENTVFLIRLTILKTLFALYSCTGSKRSYLPVRRCFRRTASSIYPDTGTDSVLLPVWIYSKISWYRTWNYRAYTNFLRLLRTGILRAAPNKICRRAC